MGRIFYLYQLWWLSLLHRLRHDLARELTVLIASLVLFATFFYVFNDFLNVQVASIAQSMQQSFAHTLTLGLLLLVTVAAIYYINKTPKRDTTSMAETLGESRSVVRGWLFCRALTLISFWHGGGWFISQRWLEYWSTSRVLITEVCLLIVTAVVCNRIRIARLFRSTDLSNQQSKSQVLVYWRLKQMIWRRPSSRFIVILATLFLGLEAVATQSGAPFFVVALATMAGGYLLSGILCVQMAEDLRHAWLERGLGVSHEEFMRSYQLVATIIGSISGLAAVLVYFLAKSVTAGYSVTILDAATASKLLPLGALSSVITPSLLLQIDGRRPAINFLIVFLATMFVGTAILAHWLGILLVPLVIMTANPNQAGRFYRA